MLCSVGQVTGSTLGLCAFDFNFIFCLILTLQTSTEIVDLTAVVGDCTKQSQHTIYKYASIEERFNSSPELQEQASVAIGLSLLWQLCVHPGYERNTAGRCRSRTVLNRLATDRVSNRIRHRRINVKMNQFWGYT